MSASKKQRSPAGEVGQLLVIGFDGTEMSPRLADLLYRVQPAGVILFARNIVNPQQTHRLLKDCQAAVSEPLFTAVDLEGGRVDRFRKALGAAPAAAEVFASARPQLFRKHGEIIGRNCRALGFNLDLAPVLDLAFESSHTVMSSRSVSQDPKQVVEYARAFLAGLRAAGVVGAGKHFPGLGEGSIDSHEDLPIINKGFHALWDEDLVPYRLMKRDLPMVLVNHASYPAVTRDRLPASLSRKWITDVLRRRIGFRGLILSDDLEMGGALRAARVDEATVEFVRAGGDLALICHEQENVEWGFEALARACERDPKFRKRARDSARRVAAFKRKHIRFLRPVPAPAKEKIERLSRQLWEFSEQIRLRQLSAGAGR
ncbi:MAG TPA: beta-N-acetylhexosaminidase [Terriglobales bacterium]